MTPLLLKDLRTNAPFLAAVVVLYGLTSVSAARAEEALFWLSIVLMVGLWVIPAAVDWKIDAERFVCSLPVARRTVVRARLAWILGAAGASAALWTAAGHLWTAFEAAIGAPPAGPSMWQSIEGVLAFAAVAATLAALFLPCYCRFGIGKGSSVFGFLTLALMSGLAVSGVIDLPGTSSAATSGMAAPRQTASLVRGIGHLRQSIGAPGAIGLVGSLAVIINAVAFRVAAGFYEEREF